MTYDWNIVLVAALTLFGLGGCQTPDGFNPSTMEGLEVFFGSHLIDAGTYVAKSVAANQPSLALKTLWPFSQPLMAMMVDPKDPSPPDPDYPPILYWLQSSLTQNIGTDPILNANDSSPLTPYLGPQPDSDGRLHQYIILVFEQPPDYTVSAKFPKSFDKFSQRGRFELSRCSTKNGMGKPIAGSYFYSSVIRSDVCPKGSNQQYVHHFTNPENKTQY